MTNVVYLKSDLFRHPLSLVRQHNRVTVSSTLLSSQLSELYLCTQPLIHLRQGLLDCRLLNECTC